MYSVSSTWRWGAWMSIVIAGIGFAILLFSYNPPRRPNSMSYTKRDVLTHIDYIGGILSIGGIALFLLGLQWGGYT